jgi:hypothetical protein
MVSLVWMLEKERGWWENLKGWGWVQGWAYQNSSHGKLRCRVHMINETLFTHLPGS